MALNVDQQAVVDDWVGARCVNAGPGSGKTTTMVALIHAVLQSGVSASEVRAVTFSKEMAKTLEQRVKVAGIVSTFHSLGYDICSETERKPVEPELRFRLMMKLIRKWKLDYKELDGFIAKMRRNNVTPAAALLDDELPYSWSQAYVEYEKVRAQEGWMDFDCQPPHTQIETPTGPKAIEDLRAGETVISWSRHHRSLRKRRIQGVTKQDYAGPMICVRAAGRATEMTPNHWVWARFNAEAKTRYAIYLMWKEDLGFRVGQCKFFSHGYSNWPNRLSHQDADYMWVLSVTTDYYEALTREVEVSVQYGIPQTAFRPMRGYPSPDAIQRIFASADPENGYRCLKAFGRLFERPLLSRREKMQQWVRNRNSRNDKPCLGAFLKISASNLLADIMSLPGREPNTEQQITSLAVRHYVGSIYSMSVEKDHTYVSDGLIVGNSMLADAVALLENNMQARGRWQPQLLIVDEAQDTDACQWRMMQLLSEKHGNITVVGDPNQCIYGFRGAQPENLTNFQQWFPKGRTFYLGQNYRSTGRIVDFVRENAPKGTPPELLSRMVAARTEQGARIGVKMYWSDDDEAESALAMAQKDPLHSIILARTNRAVGLLERLSQRHGVRYHLLGKTGFWKQTEIRKAIEALKQYPLISLEAGLNLTLPGIEAKYAVDDRTERDNDALANLQTLRLIGQRDFQMAKDFVVYANKMIHRRNDPKGVSISTVHQAKGSEYGNVFIIGANAKGFPHPKGDDAEEQRIWFVAISRAKDLLRISFAGTPSVYLRKYLTEEILDKLRDHADEVTRLHEQTKLFA